METHFVSRKQRFHTRLNSVLEGVVYNKTPSDRLVLKDDIVAAAVRHFGDHPEDGPGPTPREVCGTVDSLAERGFLLEVNGVRLERWLEEIAPTPSRSRTPARAPRP